MIGDGNSSLRSGDFVRVEDERTSPTSYARIFECAFAVWCFYIVTKGGKIIKTFRTCFLGIGSVLFAVPHLLIGPFEPTNVLSTITKANDDVCSTKNATSEPDECFSGYESNRFYLFLFCAAQMLMGAGTSPLYSLAPAYIDENVHPKASPVYLGVFFAATITGPGLGFIFGGMILNDIYVDVDKVSLNLY